MENALKAKLIVGDRVMAREATVGAEEPGLSVLALNLIKILTSSCRLQAIGDGDVRDMNARVSCKIAAHSDVCVMLANINSKIRNIMHIFSLSCVEIREKSA